MLRLAAEECNQPPNPRAYCTDEHDDPNYLADGDN